MADPPWMKGPPAKTKDIGKHPDRAFWQRLKWETNKAYAAFEAYRDMAPSKRNKSELATQLGHRNPGTVQMWSKKFMWQARIEAMETELDRKRFLEEQEDRQRNRKRNRNIAIAMQNQIVNYLQNMDWSDLSPAQVGQWFEITTKILRLDDNQSTENVNHNITGANRNANDLTEKVFGNPELAAAAVRLMEQTGPGEDEPSSTS